MNYKKKIYWGVAISVGAFFLSIVLAKPEIFGLCNYNDMKCIYNYIDIFDSIAQFVGLFSIAFFIIFSIILFCKELVFNYWKKFAKIFLSVAIILILITPTQYGGFVGIDKEMVTWGLASLFLISSLGIIIWKSIQLRKK
ncbi:MAG: hypothetical protein WC682_03520 [Parcubacteria group bacterium]|jgi:hypothetical protein